MDVTNKKEWIAQGWQAVKAEPYKHDRWVIVPRLIVVLLLGFFLAAATYKAYAEPLYALEGQDARIVLTNDPCQLDNVTNLPYRVTWTEKGKTTEGCWGISFDSERVNAFFVSDKTVVSFPPNLFTKVTGV